MTNSLKKFLPVFLLLQAVSLMAFSADQVQIRDDAPDRYEVVVGDTLWDISGRFLEDPWLWPEVWELNPQIENPHLIYPGDVIALVYSADGPMLTLTRGGAETTGLRTIRLSPQVRREPMSSAIPAIPLDQISAFLKGTIIVSETELENSPYLLGNRSGTLLSENNEEVFAKGSWDDEINEYNIVRGGQIYTDPESGAIVGLEGKHIGTATIVNRDGSNATLLTANVEEEIRKGDRFIASSGSRIDSNYFPRPPSSSIEGRIIDISSERTVGNLYDTIVINRGSKNRLRVGNLLALQKPDIEIEDDIGKATLGQQVKQSLGFSNDNVETFSGEKYATVLIYRVFEDASLGIILSADQAVRLEDRVVTP